MEKGTLIGNKVVLSSSALFNRSSFGVLNKQGGVELSSEEALYLVLSQGGYYDHDDLNSTLNFF